MLFYQDNSWVHTFVVTMANIQKMGYEQLLYAAYSSDLAFCDNFLSPNLNKWTARLYVIWTICIELFAEKNIKKIKKCILKVTELSNHPYIIFTCELCAQKLKFCVIQFFDIRENSTNTHCSILIE